MFLYVCQYIIIDKHINIGYTAYRTNEQDSAMQYLIIKQTWFVCLGILAVALLADRWSGLLLLGVALVCVLRMIGFALEPKDDGS